MPLPTESLQDLEARLRQASSVSSGNSSVSGAPSLDSVQDEPLVPTGGSFSDADLASSLTRRISQLSEEVKDEDEEEEVIAPQKPLTVDELRVLIYKKYGEWALF